MAVSLGMNPQADAGLGYCRVPRVVLVWRFANDIVDTCTWTPVAQFRPALL